MKIDENIHHRLQQLNAKVFSAARARATELDSIIRHSLVNYSKLPCNLLLIYVLVYRLSES